jgi:hypothetical protein
MSIGHAEAEQQRLVAVWEQGGPGAREALRSRLADAINRNSHGAIISSETSPPAPGYRDILTYTRRVGQQPPYP